MVRVGFYRVSDAAPYVGACPACRVGVSSLWSMSDVGSLTGARFEACEGCAERVAHIVLHTFALMSAGVRVISE